MIIRNYILIIFISLFVVAMVSGCIGRQSYTYTDNDISILTPANTMKQPLLGNETINITVSLIENRYFDVVLPSPGRYHIIVKTTRWNDRIFVHYKYTTSETYTDRFGEHEKTTSYEDIDIDKGDYYLGYSDNTNIVDTIIEIPENSTYQAISFIHRYTDIQSFFTVSVSRLQERDT